jgi:hypothetical protein
MGCEVPHWVDAMGYQCKPGFGSELTANSMVNWLRSVNGLEHGWREVGVAEVELLASDGRPTIVAYKAPPGQHGHIAMVLPTKSGIHIAQAGAVCHFDVPLALGFGALPVVFFSHT